MRKLFRTTWAASIALWASVAYGQQSVFVPATTATVQVVGSVGTTILVNGISGKQVYVTALALQPVATATVSFIAGTGAACAGTPVTLVAAMTFPSAIPFVYGDGLGAVLVTPPGFNLCIVNGAAAAPGTLSFAQF